MKTPDYDGLSRSQIARINRLQMTRYRRLEDETGSGTLVCVQKQREKRGWEWSLTEIGFWLAACFGLFIAIQELRKPETQLTTNLPANLDEQAPSITIYGGEKQ